MHKINLLENPIYGNPLGERDVEGGSVLLEWIIK
jgi:hypothetical protein